MTGFGSCPTQARFGLGGDVQMSQTSPGNYGRLSSCHGDLRDFSAVGRVTLLLSAAIIASFCLPPTKAGESLSQAWSAFGAASGFRFMGMWLCLSICARFARGADECVRPYMAGSRTGPLKPKDGLNGPWAVRGGNSCLSLREWRRVGMLRLRRIVFQTILLRSA